MTLTGAQLDAILIGAGTINLGAGTGDTINLTSTSTDLNTLGATNNSIQGVEAISAAGAAAGVTITLSGQTEAFTITGSDQADTITGGSAADTIVGGRGRRHVERRSRQRHDHPRRLGHFRRRRRGYRYAARQWRGDDQPVVGRPEFRRCQCLRLRKCECERVERLRQPHRQQPAPTY